MLLLGHRGARRYAPENTLAAFDLAMAQGCDGFEFDVRCAADGGAVICHDPRVGGLAVAASAQMQLRAAFPALTTLDAVLAHFSARAYLYIELKEAGAEDQLLAALAAHPPQRGYVVASFFPDVLEAVHLRDARIPLGFIAARRKAMPLWRSLQVEVVMPHHRLVTRALVDELHAAGKQVFVWTVNQGREMKALAALGVDAVLSDDTELLVRTLRANPMKPSS